MQNYKQPVELETTSYLGANTSVQFSLIPKEQSPRMQNAYQDEDGDISKRPGTIPLTTSPLATDIKYLTAFKSSANAAGSEDIYAASDTTLYKFNGTDTLTAQTMTNALVTSDIYTVAFINENLESILFITDGGDMKKYNGTAVSTIVPAADDPSPANVNAMAAINALLPIYTWVHGNHIMVTDGTYNVYYSKKYIFDYFPDVYYLRWNRENDYITGIGIAYGDICLIPMRRGWGVLTGSDFSNYKDQQFLNTINGNIAPRSIQKVTYPSGSQTVIYLSDDGVCEVYDNGFIDSSGSGSRVYATRSLMQGKIDFAGLGLTDAEKAAAVGVFHPEKFLYLISFQKSGVDYTYAYDTRNREWYTDWLTFNAKSYASLNGTLYFAGSAKHLQKFDVDLYSDWNESTKTTGTAVYYKRYSNALSAEFSGFQSFWDAYLLESKQWYLPSTIDITFIFSDLTDIMVSIIKGEVFVEDVSHWGYAKYVNLNFTDLVNEPNEILFDYSRLSKYIQVLVENNRDEPVKIFKEKWKARTSGR